MWKVAFKTAQIRLRIRGSPTALEGRCLPHSVLGDVLSCGLRAAQIESGETWTLGDGARAHALRPGPRRQHEAVARQPERGGRTSAGRTIAIRETMRNPCRWREEDRAGALPAARCLPLPAQAV